MLSEVLSLLPPVNGYASVAVLVILLFMREDVKDVKRRVWRIEQSYFKDEES